MQYRDRARRCAIAAGLFLASGLAQSIRWPEVRPLHQSLYFSDAETAHAALAIRGLDGQQVYRLECCNNHEEIEGIISCSGLFQCALVSSKDPRDHRDLLNPYQFGMKDWYSRGRFIADDLWANCASRPEFGAVRHFRMRGMRMTLTVNRLTFVSATQPGRRMDVQAFGLDIDVQPDASAVSEIAEFTPFDVPSYSLTPAAPNRNSARSTAPCPTIVSKHVPGQLTPEYLRKNGLVGPFPAVASVRKTFLIRDTDDHSFEYSQDGGNSYQRRLHLVLPDRSGRPSYELRCAQHPLGGSATMAVIYCELVQAGRDLNLLADGVDPYSRLGRNIIVSDQLFGDCAHYPDWGLRREFRLRGFDLRLIIDQVIPGPNPLSKAFFYEPGFAAARLTVTVLPDPSAVSPVALPSRYAFRYFEPGPGCKTPLTVSP